MATSADEVRAQSVIHYHPTRDSAVALVLLQYRPQVMVVPEAVSRFEGVIMDGFRKKGWESPALLVRGGHLASRGKVGVQGDLASGNLALFDVDRELLYGGPVPRDELWASIARGAGSIGILASADPQLDRDDFMDSLDRLIQQDKVLAAAGLFLPGS